MEKGERRKRIIARGNDRLALITGRIQNLDEDLPKSSSFNTPHRAEDAPSSQHVRSASESAAPNPNSFNQEEQERKVVDHVPETIKEDNAEEPSKPHGPETAGSEQSEPSRVITRRTNRRRTASRENEPGMVGSKGPDTTRVSRGRTRKKVVQENPPPKQPPPIHSPLEHSPPIHSQPVHSQPTHSPPKPSAPKPSAPKEEPKPVVKPDSPITLEKYLDYIITSVSLKEINFSITTTEGIRVMCTIVLAVLVVLHNVTFPQNDARSESLIGYRPLYVLLLTNVFIVAVRLVPFARRMKGDRESPPVGQEAGDGQDWGGALRMMELGLLLHQTFWAVFIGLSFYVVIVVCGITMA